MNLFKKGICTIQDVFNKSPLTNWKETKKEVGNIPYIVTREMQLKNMRPDCISLYQVANDQTVYDKFAYNTFPKFKTMEDGEVYFEPVCQVISSLQSHYVKWFMLDHRMRISHDHSYPYVRVIPDGYLMKIKLSITFDKITGFEVIYITKAADIEIMDIADTRRDGAYLEDIVDEAKVVRWTVPLLNIATFYPQIIPTLSDSERFIKTYLKDIK